MRKNKELIIDCMFLLLLLVVSLFSFIIFKTFNEDFTVFKEEDKLDCNYLNESLGSNEGYSYCIKKYSIKICSNCYK
jgi:hypothetical protein